MCDRHAAAVGAKCTTGLRHVFHVASADEFGEPVGEFTVVETGPAERNTGAVVKALGRGTLRTRARTRRARPAASADGPGLSGVDPEVAEARGVPVRALSLVFMLVLGLAVALCVQIVGALLVLALLVTPAAAAARITASPVLLPVLSVTFALVSMEGGILLALGSTVPISPYVTTISFVIYLICRLASTRRANRAPQAMLSAPEQTAARV